MRKTLCHFVVAMNFLALSLPALAEPEHKLAAIALLDDIEREYAYIESMPVDWDGLCTYIKDEAAQCEGDAEFLELIEELVTHFCDDHVFINTNTNQSPRLVPTGIDVWPAIRDDGVFIQGVRTDSRAAYTGLRPGMRVLAINGKPVEDAIEEVRPRFADAQSELVRQWSARHLIAQHRDRPVELTVYDADARGSAAVYTWVPGYTSPDGELSVAVRTSGSVQIRINNSLGNFDLVEAFDRVLADHAGAPGFIIDLRETPSGGDTTVARGIMSRFVDQPRPYQAHELTSEYRHTGIRRYWKEYVLPRGPRLEQDIVVLVGRWTGSMGEGLAIGLRDACDATIIGSEMAGLRGAISGFRVEDQSYSVFFPIECLYSIDGVAREAMRPCESIEPFVVSGLPDHALTRADEILFGDD